MGEAEELAWWGGSFATLLRPIALHVAARGCQSSLCGGVDATGKPPHRPHGDRHHGGTFTPRLHGNGPEPGDCRPARRNPSPEPAPGVCWGRGQTEERAWVPALPPHLRFPVPQPLSPATDGKTDGRTHLGTAHVSLTARAGFPWSMGFLKSVRSSSKAMIWGRGVCPSGLGQQLMAPQPVLPRDMISYTGIGPDEACCKGGETARERRGLAQGHTQSGMEP